MRILILDTSPLRRGAQVFGLELAEQLKTLGMEVSRVYLFQSNQNEILPLSTRDEILPFDEKSVLEKIPSIQPRLLKRVKEKIKSFQPEVILCNGSKTLKYGAWLRLLNLAGQAKIIGRFIDDAEFWNPGGLKKWMYSFWINRLDGIVGVSQHSLDSMIRHYHFKKPSTVIHRTFDSNKFASAPSRKDARQKLGLKEENEVLLFLGNLTAQKRPDRFLEIIAELSKTRPKIKALLVGDGPLRKELENQVASIAYQEPRNKMQEPSFNVSHTEWKSKFQHKLANSQKLGDKVQDPDKSRVLNLASTVSFKSYQQDVSPYLAAADLLILTSDTEGLPGVVLEAAYFGVPTVATDVGGIKECLIDGETGFLIPDRSVEGFCGKINFLLDNLKFRIRMGQKARSFISQQFQMDQVANQYLDFFSSLIHPNPSK